ncbi:hypothetical protein [Pedobacter punctiformis]|uniref:Carboxypeptidase regulatory-like domain-containing protein n=1 Tax=Pedobacter punctiformis TaxID=3004097 RepID=A0ABT4L9T4_9SPHI|nr:hypothetical protein [Pedobacter sp. HCMS5-2]MCZ4244442.1 hypothetical protein [Pedobacter sp. HCMS5-2]
MKTTITNISIAEPCSQNWELMEKRDGHHFCETCSKCVIDFSTYTNAEIIKTLASANSEVCGRMSQNQLNQLSYHLVVAPTQRNWMKYLGALTIGASIFLQQSQVFASTKTETTLSVLKKNTNDAKPEPVKVIYGYVIKENKQPALAGIRVAIANTRMFAFTDAKGRYEIKLDKGFDYKNNNLIVENTKDRSALKIDYSISKQRDMILMAYEPMIMGKMIMKTN